MSGNIGNILSDRIGKILEMTKTIEAKVDDMCNKIDDMNKKLDDTLYEDDIAPTRNEVSFGSNVTQVYDFITEEDIRQKGIKIPYNKLEGVEQIRAFKYFLSFVRLHEKEFTAKEIELASYADKNFSDIRISDNSRRVLGVAYQKAYRKPWEFNFIRGYLHKYDQQIAWSWADGSMD